YKENDRDAAASIWVAAWQQTMPDIDFVARRGWIIERLGNRAETGTTTLCGVSEEGCLLGFVMIEPERHWLEQLAVAPPCFGGGVGAVLLDAAKGLCAGRLGLRVNQDNPRAVRFYQREGFRIVGEGVNPGGILKTWDMLWMEHGC
ncbi:MAG TPA: GNAT family N-acetyltransferase, partial [Acetobacteraceae bacterium]|nr:GNAT family N-acetyltransferase [Acetobacteraceae bacterium]